MIIDIAAFGDRTRTDSVRHHVRRVLYDLLEHGFHNCHIEAADYYLEDRGDGAVVAISPRVRTAVLISQLIDWIHAGLRQHNAVSSDVARLRLRIGIHTGEVDTDDHGIVGTAVNHVFRLTDAPALKRMLEGSGAALAVITSDRVWEDVIRHAPDLVQPAEYAPVQVEHKETAARAWVRLVGTATAARPRPKEAARSITSFVGRDQELTELHGLIARSRLVTLVGPGGVGKTRLARETLHVLAGEVSTTCADGAYLADLADYRAGDDLCRALLNTLRSSYGPPGRGPTDEALVAALNGRRVLLVLDNCEQILDDVASVAEALLTRTDGTTLLTTSREALGMASETTFSVRPLAVPALDHREHDVRKYAAVQLFVDRAQSADPEFRLTAGNVADVARVCRSLDGLPLPIELAAARVRALTPRQITERLADRFRLLTSGSRTVSRHRTLEAVVDWSHDLLDEPAKEVFAHLAVFRGGFSLSAAEDLADRVGLCRATTADLVVRLVDKSLLQAKPADDGAMRYRMLETLREYAAGRLAERGQVEKARRHHAELYVELAERQSDALRDARQADAVRLLEREDDNLRAAFEWCCRTGNHDLALRLGAGLGWYLWMRGDRAFGWAGLARAIDIRSTEQDPVRRVRALIWSCHLGSVGHKAVEPAARVHGRQAKAILEQLGMTRTVEYGYCMFVNAFACYRENQHDDGDAMIARAVYLATELSDPWLMACATIVAGIGHALRGEFADADRRLTESAEHYRGVGDRWGEHRSLIWLSRTNEAVGRLARAEETAVAAYNLVHSLELDGAGAPLLGWIARLRVLRGNEAGAAATLALVEEHRWWRRTSEGVGWISDCQALLIEQRAGAADTAPLRRVVELYGRAATELAAAGLPVHAVYSRCRQALVLARLGAPTAVALDQAAKVANAQADRRALAVVLDTMCLVATDRAAAERLLRLADARWREVGGQRSASFVADLDRLRRGATDPGSGRFSSPL